MRNLHLTLLYLLLAFWIIPTHAAAAQSLGGLPLSEVAGEPSTQVAGHVNAITGTYSEQQTDVLLLGAEPLAFSRFYNSSDWSGGYLCDGWGHNYNHRARTGFEGKWCTIKFLHLSGGGTTFIGDRHIRFHNYEPALPRENCTCIIDRADLELGLTNCGGEELSGRNHLKNTQIHSNERRQNSPVSNCSLFGQR